MAIKGALRTCGYYETKGEKLLLLRCRFSQIVHSLLTHRGGECDII
nr:MAG TPA: POTRA domain TamA domain 1 [Caudoviricetes sp.]